MRRVLSMRAGAHPGSGGGLIEGKLGAGVGDVSPDRSSANLNRTGPTISLMAMVATARERKEEPNDGNSRAMTTANPSVRPACDTRPAQDRLRSTGWTSGLCTRSCPGSKAEPAPYDTQTTVRHDGAEGRPQGRLEAALLHER